jgi:hypothetical protein
VSCSNVLGGCSYKFQGVLGRVFTWLLSGLLRNKPVISFYYYGGVFEA